ncbi:SusC/RagA family TonB-linked outer membrane protein [Parapedobacter soli]|uniref:SusC/RagA family TonB-linked outer membrane protein n=1 Tax=Parapedobacter soli TaxID=416955 RepID=UPI0021CA6E0C|nr:SusC/RagA family TonB-linked outer membrane protein [Parapedobacter soli]
MNKNIYFSILFFVAVWFHAVPVVAQTAVSGRVTDAANEPIGGATISVQGSTMRTLSDDAGNFVLRDAAPGAVLLVSAVGYAPYEATVPSSGTLHITLSQQETLLDEIVVVGYGSMEKSKITSAITNVKAEEFNLGNINNPAQLLQGKVAGLSIVAPQGNPNGEFNIRLRGLSTLGANTQPLVIIDGVVGADLNSVDPNDIATMDVLKDGGAAAIYGTRGSSGVIIITTKTGSREHASITYNTYGAAEQMDRSLPIMSRSEYLANGGTDYGGDTDWMDAITRTAYSHVHNVSLSGGTPQFTYMGSLNYRNINGIVNRTGNEQLNGRLNLTQRAWDDRLTLNLNLSLNSRDAQLGFDDVFRSAIIMPPTAPVTSTDPEYAAYGGYFQNRAHELFNPVAIIDQNTRDQRSTRALYNLQGDLKIVDGLTASARVARTDEKIDGGSYISRYSLYGSGLDRTGLASQSAYQNQSDLFELTGNYIRRFDRLDFNLLGGYSYQQFSSQHAFTEAGNFLTDEFSYHNIAAARDFADGLAKGESFKESSKLIAFFARANLNYADTYFLSATLRREGSSRFGAGNQWGNFVGLSGGIDVSRLVSIPRVNQLKVRGSYGVTGALPEQSYLSQQIYGPGSTLTYFLFNDRFTPVYSPQSNPNPNLKWEKKEEINLGVDVGLFDSRLIATLDVYNRRTTDALIRLNVPVPPNLYPTTVLNAGELRNRGLEVSVVGDIIRRPDFSWQSRITYATNSARVISLSLGDIRYGTRDVGGLPAPLTGNVVRVQEGRPIGQMIGWIYEGVADDGSYIIRDLDNSGDINEQDFGIIGRGLPKGEFGFGNNFRYKHLDLNIFFRGVYGHDLVNLHRTMFEQVSRITTYNLIKTKHFDPAYTGPVAYNSHYVENGSFIKLDHLSLGYTIQLPARSLISSARIQLTGQNLFYITGYSGVDPEPRYSYDNNVLAPGVEPLNSWVTTRTFTLGANFTF